MEALMTDAVSIAFLDDFAAAWNRHDTDAILSMMTEDCVFETSRGPDVKETVYTGQGEVRRGIEEVFATLPDARLSGPKHPLLGIAASQGGSSRQPGRMTLA